MRKGHPEFAAISKLVVHHTVTQNNDPDPAQTVRAIYAYHTRGNGWNDIGYTGCPGGRLYERLPEIRQRVADTIGSPASRPPPPRPAPLPAPAPPAVPEFPGFWSAGSDGRVRVFGDARPAGDLAGRKLAGPIVSLAATPGGHGYWMAGADGGVFAFGDAPFLGAPVGQFRSAAVRVEPTPSGKGYWVLSAGGEVAAFGDAAFRGQLFPLPLAAVGLASTPSGQGYWIAPAVRQVRAFGGSGVFVGP